MENCKRRSTDIEQAELDASFSQCPAFKNHEDVVLIHKDLQEIKATVAEMRDIIVAWQDAKAFFKVIKLIGEFLKWTVAVGATVGIIWYFVTGRDK
jgi:hypothetical protein